MAKLQTMDDSIWTVQIGLVTRTYNFRRGGTVRWSSNGRNVGNGTWRIEHGKMITRWNGSKTWEAWDLPLDTGGSTGKEHTQDGTFDLKAKKNVGEGTLYIRSDEAKRNFLEKCDLASGILQESVLTFTAWLSNVAISYGNAFTSHTKFVTVINDIRETEDLVAEALLSAALSFVSGGVGGLVSKAMVNAKIQNAFIFDSIKDLSKLAVKNEGGAVIGVFANKGQGIRISGMPVSPLQWQNSVTARVTSELAVVARSINEWRVAVMDDNSRFNSGFDPAVEVDKSLVLRPDQGRAVSIKKLPALDDTAMLKLQHQFEQGWFAAWIPDAEFAGEKSFTYPNGDYSGREQTRNVLLSYGHKIEFPNVEALVDKYAPGLKPFIYYVR